MSNAKFIYQCCDCGKQYESTPELYLCPSCSAANNPTTPPKGVFKTVYDYKSLSKSLDAKSLTASN